MAAWELARYPRGEVLFGRAGAVHGTNFWVPPLGRPNGVVTVHDLTFLLYPEFCTPQVRRYRWILPQVLKRCAVVLTPWPQEPGTIERSNRSTWRARRSAA